MHVFLQGRYAYFFAMIPDEAKDGIFIIKNDISLAGVGNCGNPEPMWGRGQYVKDRPAKLRIERKRIECCTRY